MFYLLYVDNGAGSYYITELESSCDYYRTQKGSFRLQKTSYDKEELLKLVNDRKLETLKYTVFFDRAAGDSWYERTHCFYRGESPRYHFKDCSTKEEADKLVKELRHC